jgi:hypothetical protein
MHMAKEHPTILVAGVHGVVGTLVHYHVVMQDHLYKKLYHHQLLRLKDLPSQRELLMLSM